MPSDDNPFQSNDARRRLHQQTAQTGPLGRLLAYVGTAVVIGLSLMFSVVVFALVVTVGAIAWGYFWWKTRAIRKQMREQFNARMNGGDASWGQAQTFRRPPNDANVIEGEVIREVPGDEPPRRT